MTDIEATYIATWRHRLTDPDRIALHETRRAAHAARDAAGAGLVERLPWPLEVEASGLGLRPCPRCPTGWMRAIADDSPDLRAGCPSCGFAAEVLDLGIGTPL